MSDSLESTSVLVSDREVLTTRVMNASREAIFDALTDPQKLARWWGPKGFTNTFHEFEPRPGGAWRFVMRGPDGTDYKNHSVFADVIRPEKFAFKHVSGPVYAATISLEDLGGRTKILWRMRFENAKFVAENKSLILTGNNDNLDRLGDVLAAG